MKPDILFGEKSGFLAVIVNPEGRLREMAQSSDDTPKAWVYGQTVVPAINLLMSGTLAEGWAFVNELKRKGIVVEEGSVYVPFGNPDRHDYDPNVMLREEACLCRGDGPSSYPRLIRHLVALTRTQPTEWR